MIIFPPGHRLAEENGIALGELSGAGMFRHPPEQSQRLIAPAVARRIALVSAPARRHVCLRTLARSGLQHGISAGTLRHTTSRDHTPSTDGIWLVTFWDAIACSLDFIERAYEGLRS